MTPHSPTHTSTPTPAHTSTPTLTHPSTDQHVPTAPDARPGTGPHARPDTRLSRALAAGPASVRLQAALAAGTHPDPGLVALLVERCAVEPDFFVRDMLTWALTRHPAAVTVPLLLAEVRDGTRQARSQALHTLSKIGDARGWDAISAEVLHHPDEDVARTAWRAAVNLVPAGREAELAEALCTELGRGDREAQRSLSRAIAALGDAGLPSLQQRERADDEAVRTHALATRHLLDDPDADFGAAVAEAQRVAALAAAPTVPDEVPAPAVADDVRAPATAADVPRSTVLDAASGPSRADDVPGLGGGADR
ncbi:HEAT repeat domain-containing protein [Cellulomonas sp. NS3]|uniref:HEAT repeat domain-containing protein n=1 Tax=Cellulomonas sp. NS3 TaxID=2973977 RepID=UPI00216181C0|nr:HEAT repeat domain-containing protein [Cellulomonas sp. NS3]